MDNKSTSTLGVSIRAASSLVKQSQSSNEVLRALALRDVVNTGLLGFGVGAGSRGLYGLFNLLTRQQRGPEQVRPVGHIPTEFPVEKDEKEKKKKLAHDGLDTVAPTRSDTEARPYGIAPPWLANVPFLDDEAQRESQVLTKQAGFWSGTQATTRTGIPWYLTGNMAAGTGGAVGGWKLMDLLLDRRRSSAQEDELEKAREEFREALLSRRVGTKRASDGNTLGEDLDLLFDTLSEKCASTEKAAADEGEGSDLMNLLGQGAGVYGLYAAGSGLLGGVLMYNAAKKRQRRALLEQAKKERERMAFERRPPRIEAFPFPVSR